MATSAGWYPEENEEKNKMKGRDSAPQSSRALYRIRPLPNEAICLWRKTIDNSAVVRPSDRKTPVACLRSILAALTIAAGLLGFIAPYVYGTLADMEVHRLTGEREALLRSKETLDVEEARLLSPERMQHLAQTQGYVDPPSQAVYVLPDKGDESLALNSRSTR